MSAPDILCGNDRKMKKIHYQRQMYNAYDPVLKQRVIKYAEQKGNKMAQLHFGINEANIRRWRRQKQDIFSNWRMCKATGTDSEVSLDSMPLQERLTRVQSPPEKNPLKSQPLSPTKLKVSRNTAPPPVNTNEEMCLRWNSHHSNMQTAFPNILSKEQYVDVTLAAEGKTLKCHRLILSSCSPYFEEILSGISPFQHPVLFMKDIPFWILKSLCDFMYAGEVHVFQNKLEELLTVAEALKIKGLAGKSTSNDSNQPKKSETKKKPEQSKESTSRGYDSEDIDPLDLLEPLYEEVADEKPSTMVKPKLSLSNMKKVFPKKIKKRKLSETREAVINPTPPVFSFRKGTRSRPNVKIPKYYHSDFAATPKTTPLIQSETLLEMDEIKTEPIDVEENIINYSDEENHYEQNSSPLIIAANEDTFKKIKLSLPVTVSETEPPIGGLEVIKITLAPPVEEGLNHEPPIAEADVNHVTNEEQPVLDDALTVLEREAMSLAGTIAENQSESGATKLD